MKKKILDNLIGFIGVCAFVCVLGLVGDMETTYKLNGTITEVNGDAVVFVDSHDNEWVFYGEDFSIGDKVVAKMFDAETQRIEDDVILNIKLRK